MTQEKRYQVYDQNIEKELFKIVAYSGREAIQIAKERGVKNPVVEDIAESYWHSREYN